MPSDPYDSWHSNPCNGSLSDASRRHWREERAPWIQHAPPDRRSFASARGSLPLPSSLPRFAGRTKHRWNPTRRARPPSTRTRAPIGLAIEIDNGVGQPLHIQKGQRFYLNQIDMRASVDTTQDEGVSTLAHTGDFADLRWEGTRLVDQEFVLLSNPDETFTRRRFYRDAAWMDARSTFTLEQQDEDGRRLAPPLVVNAGGEEHRRARDAFFVRRLRAIQWAFDCRTSTDCAGAQRFTEEALVELRYAMHPDRTFVIDPRATHLTLTWSLNPDRIYTIPVTHAEDPPFAYGFSIDLDPVTSPRADGTYAPGSDVTFRITLRDGEGQRLHPEGWR
jgi:hypothetical protein